MSSFLISMNPTLFQSAAITFPDQLITKSMLTILCQLTYTVGASFVQRFFSSLLNIFLLSHFSIFLNSLVEEHHLLQSNVAGSNPYLSILLFSLGSIETFYYL